MELKRIQKRFNIPPRKQRATAPATQRKGDCIIEEEPPQKKFRFVEEETTAKMVCKASARLNFSQKLSK